MLPIYPTITRQVALANTKVVPSYCFRKFLFGILVRQISLHIPVHIRGPSAKQAALVSAMFVLKSVSHIELGTILYEDVVDTY